MANDDLLERLMSARPEYEAERQWHKLLLDAFAGTGGFEGKIRQPFASYWGSAADVYTRDSSVNGISYDESSIDSYLDRFPREDAPKYARRTGLAAYANYVEPIVDIRLSYMHRKGLIRDGYDAIAEWLDDATGAGESWDRVLRSDITLRAAVLGWCPVLFDRTDTGGREMTLAEAREAGVRTNAIPLFPANLLDWSTDDRGGFTWAKILASRIERPDPLSKGVHVDLVQVWYATHVDRWRIVRLDGEDPRVEPLPPVFHDWGEVPLRILRHKPLLRERVRGAPMAAGPTRLAKRLFNYQSELDHHIRSTVFAFLQVPAKNMAQVAQIVIGDENAVPVPPDATQGYAYIAPPPSVAETLERRITTTVQEMYRMGRTEYTRSGTGPAESAQSRGYQFESTNRAIADFAAQVAEFDQSALRLVGRMEGTEVEDATTTAPDKFDVEEMSRELDEALKAVTLDLGSLALAELRKRVVGKVLPNLPEEVRKAIEDELDQRAVEAVQERQLMREAMMGGPEDEGAVDDEEDDDEDEGNAPPGRRPGRPTPTRG